MACKRSSVLPKIGTISSTVMALKKGKTHVQLHTLMYASSKMCTDMFFLIERIHIENVNG
jgi:hypothetical protein